ncbi:MAG: glucose-6-phosphate dehydrogenase, partial [Chromatiaceae bacterium]
MNDACAYVIFGATGNLATTKLLPALYHLDQADRLGPGLRIICSGRRPLTAEAWLAQVREAIVAKARGGLDETLFA